MDLAGKYLVVWLSPEAIETFLGVLEPSQDGSHDYRTWTWTMLRLRGLRQGGPPTAQPEQRWQPQHGFESPTGSDSGWQGSLGFLLEGLALCHNKPNGDAGSLRVKGRDGLNGIRALVAEALTFQISGSAVA